MKVSLEEVVVAVGGRAALGVAVRTDERAEVKVRGAVVGLASFVLSNQSGRGVAVVGQSTAASDQEG